METKRDIEAKAKALLSTSPDEAVQLYKEIFEVYPDDFNMWDAFNTIKAMRSANSPDLLWAHELALKHTNDKVRNLYSWLIFDKCVKGKNRSGLIANENFIVGLPTIASQKNLKEDSTFPCPLTISILKLCDAHAENLFNARKIDELLSILDVALLSNKPKTIDTQERGEVELSSDLEKYFALRTKALFKLGDFENCIEYCKKALSELPNFHYNNDLWFKMRIALSEENLGNHTESESLLITLLESKAGSDKWFLYRDISEVYFEQGNFSKAWKYAVDSAFHGNEPHFLIGLYLLQARILFKLKRETEGKILAELIASILKEQGWSDKSEYTKLFSFYNVDRDNIPTVNKLITIARKFWQSERYGNNPKIKGKVISIHQNGKIGRIKDLRGKIVGFHKKDLTERVKNIESINGATVEFYSMKTYDNKIIAESIDVIEKELKPLDKSLLGMTLNATVKSIAEFGVFFHLDGLKDGLLHKNSLPNHLKSNFKESFIRGDKAKVKVEKITDKGIQLILVSKS